MKRVAAAPVKETFARDLDLERSYHYDRQHYHSTPGYVSGELDALVKAFLRDRVARDLFGNDVNPHDELLRWEEKFFGRKLEAAAHGVLWAAVRAALAEARAKAAKGNG